MNQPKSADSLCAALDSLPECKARVTNACGTLQVGLDPFYSTSVRIMFKSTFAFLFALCVNLPALAEQRVSVADALSAFISMSESQCDKEHASNGALTSDQRAAMQGTRDNVCVCMPEQARKLRISLSKSESDRVVTAADFQQQYAPRIINACAANQLRMKFHGERCTSQPLPKGINGVSFCSCMEERIREIPDAEVAQLGADMSDFGDKMREAEVRHAPQPAKPDSVTKFMSIQSACARR
jgi:hypothetical protein